MAGTAGSRAARAPDGGGPATVFVVDDDPGLASVLLATLARDGARVRLFADAESSLEWARREPPDLILFDLELGGMSGFEAARRLRGHERTGHVPILVVSGHGDCASRTAAFASGADCFLAKPYTVDELRAIVRSLAVRGRRLRDSEPGSAVLYALSEIVDIRCLDARGHMERSARMARAFGEWLGFGEPDLLALERAGSLHDIGKLGIPPEIINKPGPLTAAERRIMEQHPVLGARICEPLATLAAVVPIIRHHHERWDGSGYPDGLSGDAIPLLARAFQVVDVYEALISARCYKDAIEPARALGILRDEAAAGSWDSRLVGHLAEALAAGPLAAAAGPPLA